MKPSLLVILGPTAVGKTKVAVSLASVLAGEIISADSRQVFKGMDIGTGKDLSEYVVDGQQIPYHLIDHREAGSRYQVNAFKEDFYEAFADITSRSILPILCGGTGMYIHSLLQEHPYTAVPVNSALREVLLLKSKEDLQEILLNYPHSLRQHADLSTSKRLIRAIEIAEYLSHHQLETKMRPVLAPYIIGLTSTIARRRDRIHQRLQTRLQQGLIEEVEALLAQGVSAEMLVFYGLEYKFVIAYLQQEINFEQLQDRLFNAICQYAKRQMTFFRKMEKDGLNIHWYDVDNQPALRDTIIEDLKLND